MKKRRFGRDSLLIISYVILFVSMVFFKLDFLIWLVNVPLLLLVYKKPLKKAALLSLKAVIPAIAFILVWVIAYSLDAYLVSFLLFASFVFFFAVAFSILSGKIRGYLQIFIAPFAHLVLMIPYSFSILSSYWAEWAMFQPAAPLIWLVGGKGVTFLIILVHSIIAFCILKKDRKILATGIFIALILLANFAYSYNAKPEGKKIKVALLQGNFYQNREWRHKNAKGIVLDTYESMSMEAARSRPRIIVWPEYAILDDALGDSDLTQRISGIAKKANAYIVFGAFKFQEGFYKNERHRNDIAIVFSPEGNLIGEYASTKPLPFERWVLPGNETKIFKTEIASFGVSLCYEETQSTARDFSGKGAQFLVSLANNQQIDYTPGIHLTNLYTNLRAAENGKYLVRATNTGITKIANPYGKAEAELGPYERGILVGEIYLNDRTTFYTRHGNLILNIALIILAILFFVNLRKNRD